MIQGYGGTLFCHRDRAWVKILFRYAPGQHGTHITINGTHNAGIMMTHFKEKKCLIAYFSRKGDNYVSGRIVNLKTGNTEVAAAMIRDMTGGDLFYINTMTPYPADYTETTGVAKREMRENARPELTDRATNMDAYEVIFLGYPNWWGTVPMAVCTFLESYNFSGKTIVPFCTHEGSGLGRSEKDIAALCPNASLVKGFAIFGSRVKDAERDIRNWLGSIGI